MEPSAFDRTWGDNDFNYESHTLLIQTFAHGLQLATRLSTEMQSRRHVIHPAHAILPKAREIHPAPLANEGGRLYWYRTREAAEEALIPVALPTQLDCPTQAASGPPRHVVYKVGGGHLEPELSSEPEKAHHRQAMTQSEKIAS